MLGEFLLKNASLYFSISKRSVVGFAKGLPDLKACFSLDSTVGANKSVKLPEEPQNCCMSGCANCVWIAYAEEVAKILNDRGETAKQIILKNVKDPNLRAFLLLELQHLFKK